MKRSGFTMIELIFVIVILGILAAVAIPKLAATRDDAKVSKGASELATLVSDMGAYYTAQGHFGPMADMTNVKLNVTSDYAVATGFNANYQVNGADCIQVNASGPAAADGNFTLTHTDTATTGVCYGIAAAADEVTGGVNPASMNHSFGGSSVNFD